jgi:hypothetical protein
MTLPSNMSKPPKESQLWLDRVRLMSGEEEVLRYAMAVGAWHRMVVVVTLGHGLK